MLSEKSLLTILLAAATAPVSLAQGTFSKTGSMNTARVSHTATLLLNGEVLVAGGSNYTDGYLSSTELYNPSNGKFVFTSSMTVPRDSHKAVRLANGEVLGAGGVNNATCCGAPPLASAEIYNPTTGQ
jgi:hypothetical protein